MIPLDLISKPFVTTTLSDTSDISNPDQDVHRLQAFLDKFDKEVVDDREKK